MSDEQYSSNQPGMCTVVVHRAVWLCIVGKSINIITTGQSQDTAVILQKVDIPVQYNRSSIDIHVRVKAQEQK